MGNRLYCTQHRRDSARLEWLVLAIEVACAGMAFMWIASATA